MHKDKSRVVVVGAGFAGLTAARRLGRAGYQVTLIDRNNYHLFQPLLYQVTTGSLAPGDIAATIRSVVSRYRNVSVVKDEARDLNVKEKVLITKNGRYHYDFLIVAAGSRHSYFGHDEWRKNAPGLKSIEDAIRMRSRILSAFEEAEQTDDPELRRECLTFAVIGGGPTGVELAGALADLAHRTLKREFRKFSPAEVTILLLERDPQILPGFHPETAQRAERMLIDLGVKVLTGAKVISINRRLLEWEQGDRREQVRLHTVLWAAGVTAASFSTVLAKRAGADLDTRGRVHVTPYLSIPDQPEIFVLGDLAHVVGEDGRPLPGVAPVAIQQGKYLARSIISRSKGKAIAPFRFRDKGSMAVIGKGQAVAEIGRIHLSAFPAWITWAFTHIYYLIEFENKFSVFFHWAWNYLTNKNSSRIITRNL